MSKTPVVIKRDGSRQEIHFDKITKRIADLANGNYKTNSFEENRLTPLNNVNPVLIAQQVIAGVYDGIKTTELDSEAARIAHSHTMENPEYNLLASRILVSNLHKETEPKFSLAMNKLNEVGLLNENTWNAIYNNKEELDNAIIDENDFNNYDYFGFKTLETGYLTRVNNIIIERPQYALMRVVLGLHYNDIPRAIESYRLMSAKYMTHATPTLFHSGMKRNQCSSCFLVYVGDSITEIFNAIGQCAQCSKHAGGIGIHFNDIRSRGSTIKGTHGKSDGPIPFLKVFNETANAVNQGGRRAGSIAVYMEPHHPDILEFLQMRLNSGSERERARDLFPALWTNNLFMERVIANETWSLFCPSDCPDLTTSYGNEYKKKYIQYEKDNKYKRQLPAQEIWKAVLKCLSETGLPYILNKDSCNERNNQANLGTLKGSNLCAEILIYTSPEEIGTCNLASVALSKFVEENSLISPTFNFKKLYNITRILTYNLNRVIDVNYYPVAESRNSNLKHRPIAIGVTGLWDAIMQMGYDFTSNEAIELNRQIFETMYYGFLSESLELAKKDGAYSTFNGSPLSQGLFQFDLWDKDANEWNRTHPFDWADSPEDQAKFVENMHRPLTKLSGMWDWEMLREEIKVHGVRNSLGIALMPTASTSNIMGFSECFECITTNQYIRRTKSGEFYIVNKYLYNDLNELGLWTKEIRDQITMADGSIQNISVIPNNIKEKYKTIYEQDPKKIIDLSVARSPFIDHTESHNTYISDFNYSKVSSILMYAQKKGLKTMNYYLRQQVKSVVKFAVKQEEKFLFNEQKEERDEIQEGCAMCE